MGWQKLLTLAPHGKGCVLGVTPRHPGLGWRTKLGIANEDHLLHDAIGQMGKQPREGQALTPSQKATLGRS